MNKNVAEYFKDKEVVVFPGDTVKKRAIVKEVDDTGVLLEVTWVSSSQDNTWIVGKTIYYPLEKLILREY